jgi:hypothetical protein
MWATGIGLLGTTVALIFAAGARGLIDDDAYIFLRYAQHLAAGDGLSFNSGEPSIGVTSILWVLVLASVRWLTGADVMVLAQILGACAFGVGLAVMTRTVESDGQPATVARLAGVITALSPVFVCQVVSGMEVGLNMALVAVAIAGLDRGLTLSGVATGLAFLTRPDNALLAPVLAVFRQRARWRAAVILSMFVVVFGVPWILYCYHFAGTLLPPTRNGKLLVFMPGWYGLTARQFAGLSPLARVAFTGRVLLRVAAIFTQGQARSLLLWMALLPFGVTRVGRKLRAPLALFALSALAYALAFPLVKLRYFVHLLPWLVPVALVAVHRLAPARTRGVVLAAIVLLHVGLTVRAWPRYRAWVACEGTKTLAGQWLAAHTTPGAHLAMEPIGAIGYHSRRYIIDLGGLITSDVWPVIDRGPAFDPSALSTYLRRHHADYLIDSVNGPWAGRLSRALPDSLHLTATIPGRPGCGEIGIYAVSP